MAPERWVRCTLGDFCAEVSERAGTRDLPVLSVSKDLGIVLQSEKFKKRIASADTSKYKCIRRGQFAYDPMLLWAGNVGRQLRVDAGVVSPAYTVFDAAGDIDADFLERVLKDPRMRSVYRNVSRGTNVRRQKVLFSDFASIPLLLPPRPEQRKIAAILSAVDEIIEKTKAVMESLRTLKKVMMRELLTRGLPGRHTRFKQTEVGEIPEEWDVVDLQSLCSSIVDCLHSTPTYVDGGPCMAIRTADVVPGRLLLERALRVSEATYKVRIARLSPLPGDVFYSREGERFGIAAPVPQGARVCLAQRMIHLRAGANVSSSYLMWLLNSPGVYDQALADVGGSTSPHVNIGSIKRFRVPRPSVEEQIRIAAAMDAFVEQEGALQLEAVAARNLKADLMSVLLTGELRVTPDEDAA